MIEKNLFNNIVRKNYSNLRIPYMGSKQKIAEELMYKMLEIKPNAKYFIDLCAGGGSMSFLAMQMGLRVHYNDLQTDLVNFIEYIINRVKNNEKSKYGLFPEEFYNFVDRETFIKHKNENTLYGQFVRICYSFGNNQKNYLFGKDIEKYKEVLHNVVIFKSIEASKSFLEMIGKQNDFDNFKKIYEIENQNERKFFIRDYVLKNTVNKLSGKHNDEYLYCDKQDYEIIKDFSIVEKAKWLNENKTRLIELQRLQQLERLERLERQNITLSNLSYKDVIINTPPEETIIYIDPPYRNTAKYIAGKDFDYQELDGWFRNHNYTCFMSEYNAPHKCILEIKKESLFNSNLEKRKFVIEKLFWNEIL
jgi:16S rRNA G966 N2-methylase RsmD